MEIKKEPDKILREKLKIVKPITPDMPEVILDMKKIMHLNKGVGLAANQVGLNMQLFVIDEDIAQEHEAPSAYINPKITGYSKDTDEMEEGCLSLPEYYTTVERPKKIMIKALDESGKKFKFKAKGFLARILQHEYDHLQGILINDYK